MHDENLRINAVIYSEITEALSHLPPSASVMLCGLGTLEHVPPELFSSGHPGDLYFIASNKDALDNTLARNGLGRYPMPKHWHVQEADVSFVPRVLREEVRKAMGADLKDMKEAALRLRNIYATYKGRSLPVEMEKINAELVISTIGMDELYNFFYQDIVRPLAKKFGIPPTEVESVLLSEEYAKDWEKISGRLLTEHALMLYRACHPHGLIYFCTPFALWDPRNHGRQDPVLAPQQVMDGYRLVAQAWQRGLVLPGKTPPPFTTELWNQRLKEGARLRWFSPAAIVVNAQGTPFADYFRTVSTNVFASPREYPSGGMPLFQSLLLTPDMQVKGYGGPGTPAEKPLLPASKQPSLPETFSYLLPRLKSFSTVEERLDLIIDTIRREHPDASQSLIPLFDQLGEHRDMDVIRALMRKLTEDKVISREERRDLASALMLDKAGATPSAEEAVNLVMAADEEPSPRTETETADIEKLLQSEIVRALSGILEKAIPHAGSNGELQELVRKTMQKDRRTGGLDVENMFVLDRCVYLKLPVADKEIPLRFYRQDNKPFNVLRGLSTSELIAGLRHPSVPGLQVQAQRHSQVHDADSWNYEEARETAKLARDMEREGTDAVGAFKALHHRLLRPEFFALMNRLDLSALYTQVRSSKDPEALAILDEYEALAEAMHELETAIQADWKNPDIVAHALGQTNEKDDGHYLDAVIWTAQLLQDRALGRPYTAQHVRDALAQMLEGMPAKQDLEFFPMVQREAEEVLRKLPDGKTPENITDARNLLKALDFFITKTQVEIEEWKHRSWWQTLFDTTEELSSEVGEMQTRLSDFTTRRNHLLDMLIQGIVQRIPPSSRHNSIPVYLSGLDARKWDYVLSRIKEILDQDIVQFLALTTLPLESPQDTRRLDRMLQALQGVKLRGVELFKNAPFYKQKHLITALYEGVQESLNNMPYYRNGHLQDRLREARREETPMFWDREIAFRMLLEALKAKYGQDLMLLVESADTARREDMVLDTDPERSSGHALTLVLRPAVSLSQARDFVDDMKRVLGTVGVSAELYHPDGFGKPGLGVLPDQTSRAALLKGASPVDQCVAVLENEVHWRNNDPSSKDLMQSRLAAAKGAAVASPREVLGYVMLQRLLMKEYGELHMPQRLAHYVLRAAFAKMLFETGGKALNEMGDLLQGNVPRGFSYAADVLARRHLANDKEELALIHQAYQNEAKLFVVEYSPALQDFIDNARMYVEKTVADLAQAPAWNTQEDKDALRAMIALGPLFQQQGVRWYKRGQKVVEQGGHAKSVYWVLSGSAEIACRDETGRRVRRKYETGSLIAEKCVFPGVASDADITASSDLLLMEMNKTQFWHSLDQNLHLKKEILDLLYESEIANLIKAREAAARGSDPSGILIGILLGRVDEMATVFKKWGISEEKITMYMKGRKDANDVQKEVQERDLGESAAMAERGRPSFFDTLTPLLTELQGLTTVAARVDRIVKALREQYDMPEHDTTIRLLEGLKDTKDRWQLLASMQRAGILPEQIAELLKEEPMPPAAEEMPWVVPLSDPAAWNRQFRKDLARQGVPLADGKYVYGQNNEGQWRPLKEVQVPFVARPEPFTVFLDISPDTRLLRYYRIPAGSSVEDFLRRVQEKSVKPFLEVSSKGQREFFDHPREEFRGPVLMHYGPDMYPGIWISHDAQYDHGFRPPNMQDIRLHQALAEAGLLQGGYRNAVVIGTRAGALAAALAQMQDLKDLYYSDVSPYALAATRLHLAKNGHAKGLREHAVLGYGLRAMHAPHGFDLLVAYVQPSEIGLQRDGLLREFLESAPNKLNKDNPDAQWIISTGDMDAKIISKLIAECAQRYFVEPLGYGDGFYRLRWKNSQAEPQEIMGPAREQAIVRERLRNLDPVRGRTLTEEELYRAFEEVFGKGFARSPEYQAFLWDFSGTGDFTYQIWHSYLPAQLSLAQNIRLLAGILRHMPEIKGEAGKKVFSLDLRPLITQFKDEDYRIAFLDQWAGAKPEEGIALTQSQDDPYSLAVSTMPISKPVVPMPEAVVPVERPAITPAAAPAPAAVAAGKPMFVPMPQDPGEQFFQLLALPEEALEMATSYRLSILSSELQTLDEPWLNARGKILSDYPEVMTLLRNMLSEYGKAGLTLKIALAEKNDVVEIGIVEEGKAHQVEFRSLLQRGPDNKVKAIVIPAGAFLLAPKGTFVTALKPVLQHHLNRKIIADSIQKGTWRKDLERRGIRVQDATWNKWVAQISLFAAVLDEWEKGIPPRVVDILQSATDGELQSLVKNTDASLNALRQNRIFDFAQGDFRGMLERQRKQISALAEYLLNRRASLPHAAPAADYSPQQAGGPESSL